MWKTVVIAWVFVYLSISCLSFVPSLDVCLLLCVNVFVYLSVSFLFLFLKFFLLFDNLSCRSISLTSDFLFIILGEKYEVLGNNRKFARSVS